MAEPERPHLAPVLSPSGDSSSSQGSTSPQFLSVDETKRPRANSDPVGLHINICPVPEIMVTGEDDQDTNETDGYDNYLIPPSPRRRANTCPEDMFIARKGRPPTPPPMDLNIHKSPTGKRFSFNFTAKDLNGVSFAHHKLSKVSEDTSEQQLTKRRDVGKKDRELELRLQGNDTGLSCQCPSTDKTQTSDDHLQSCLNRLSLEEQNESTSVNNNEKELQDNGVKSEVIISPDSWNSKDSAQKKIDNARLRAF